MGMVVGTVISIGILGKIVIIAPVLIITGICGIIFLPKILGIIYSLLCFFMRKKRERISRWYDDLQESLIIRKNLGRLFAALGISIITWICKLCMFSCLLISIGVSGIPLWKIFFASAMTDLTMALPIHGLFSVGTVETGWMAGFAIVGVDGLVEAGFSVHLLWLSMAILLSILTLPWLFFAAGRQKSQKEND